MTDKILIIGPSWVGDMVMAQALFKVLRQQQPTAQIDVLAPQWSLPVLERMPEINNIISLEITHGEFGLRKRFSLAKKLRADKYNRAIVLTNTWKSALIPWLAKIPIRTGWLGELRWVLLNDVRYLNKIQLPKMVQRYVALGLDANTKLPIEIPAPKLTAPEYSVAAVLKKFNLQCDAPILALCPGAAYGPAKRWPEEYYVQVAEEKLAAGWQIWLFGSQQDEQVINNIQSKIPAPTISFAAKINLHETIDLLSSATAVVTNDSGLLHIAASLNKPLVAIYGSTSPLFTPPLGVKSKILTEDLPCSPCFARECKFKHLNCMYLIKPEKVLTALTSLEKNTL